MRSKGISPSSLAAALASKDRCVDTVSDGRMGADKGRGMASVT